MKGHRGKMSIQGVLSIETYWRGIRIHHHYRLLCGLNQGEETMKMNIPLRGIIDDKRSRMLFHINQSHCFGEADTYMRSTHLWRW